ncbi:MAG TPA: hypothetical protein VIH42_13735 [Thermoguttaceae bacterium]
MKAEIRFENGNLVVLVTDVIQGKTWTFGPFTFDEANALLRDSDRQREMVSKANVSDG